MAARRHGPGARPGLALSAAPRSSGRRWPAAPWVTRGLCRQGREHTPSPAGVLQASQGGPCTFVGSTAAFWCTPATSLRLSVLPRWPLCALRGPAEPSCPVRSRPLAKDFLFWDFGDLSVDLEAPVLRQPRHTSQCIPVGPSVPFAASPAPLVFWGDPGPPRTSWGFPVASVCLLVCSRTLLAPLGAPGALGALWKTRYLRSLQQAAAALLGPILSGWRSPSVGKAVCDAVPLGKVRSLRGKG